MYCLDPCFYSEFIEDYLGIDGPLMQAMQFNTRSCSQVTPDFVQYIWFSFIMEIIVSTLM